MLEENCEAVAEYMTSVLFYSLFVEFSLGVPLSPLAEEAYEL